MPCPLKGTHSKGVAKAEKSPQVFKCLLMPLSLELSGVHAAIVTIDDNECIVFPGPANGDLPVSADQGQCGPQREANHAGGHTVRALL